ncbi:MAG TPA: ImmA/IrrE family metallo-endopeptidase [Terriglobia bacterium]|nr:ImmA/IrrE family metallo-endopeptidase [Terriglobia bacterium]
MSFLERGFKAWAEQLALGIRRDMGLAPHAPLPPSSLAQYLNVELWTPHDVPGLPKDALDQLLYHDPDGWSAVSCFVNGRAVIIYNPRHSSGRQSSDLGHELAHIILEHQPSKLVLSYDGSITMRSFDEKQEEEANWLGWCLLLPRQALVQAIKSRLKKAEIAQRWGVSEQLVEFRIRMTGVRVQYGKR